MLSTYSQLETLSVRSNQLGDLDASGIFASLNSLTYLDLSDYKINSLVGSNTFAGQPIDLIAGEVRVSEAIESV